MCGVKVLISGDHDMVKPPSLIIMNHRTRLDWLFLWCYLLRRGKLLNEKIVLKDAIKKIPIFGKQLSYVNIIPYMVTGWGTQVAGFIFLTRKWHHDEQLLSNGLRYFNKSQYPLQLLLFPEGTDLSDYNKAKSQQFAKDNQLQVYQHVLQPRTKGFIKCIEELCKDNYLYSIVDITVAYVGTIPQNERDIAAGQWPSEIHFDVKMFSTHELPVHDEYQMEQWLQERWRLKEELLTDFYQHNKFKHRYTTLPQDQCFSHLLMILITWSVFNLFVLYLMFTSWLLWLLLITGTITFLYVSHRCNGVEQLEHNS